MAREAGSFAEHDIARRLMAVLAADVVGYSRLMASDEIATLNQLKSLRNTVVDPLVARHRGEIVGTAGDSFLVAFASAVDAVSCAVAWQKACVELAGSKQASQEMLFRIGIHLGDVIPEDGTIYGDGVNIAARLEKLAQPAGIVVSRAIRDQVEDRLDIAFTDLGQQELKNIARPVEAFAIRLGQGMSVAASQQKAAGQSTRLSIAILPFNNMSGEREQDYFSDGITEDIITEISRFKELDVIGRNSSFAFRGQNLEIKEIATKLGVQFIVEGSVRKSGNRVRITTQLVEAPTDRHLWAERYDRSLDDIFAIQDEIARTIATIVAGHVSAVGAAHAQTRPTENLNAYDLVLRTRSLFRQYTSHEERLELAMKAVELDPNYALAHAVVSHVLITRSLFDGDLRTREQAADYARRAISLDPDEPWGHSMLGMCLMFLKRMPEAGMHFDRALQLNPNEVKVKILYGLWHCFSGHLDKAAACMEDALKRDPFGHEWYWDDYGITLVVAGRYAEAITAYDKMVAPAPWSYAFAAIAHVNMGNIERARDLARRCLEANPGFPPEDYFRSDPFVDPAVPERLIADLRKAL